MEIRPDDLRDARVRALVTAHQADMYATSPPESVHALGLEVLRDPAITVCTAWEHDVLLGIGALARRDAARGELKSMRVTDEARGTGVGRALLRHLVALARTEGLRSLWLETGAEDAFLPARRLYASEGFVVCGPFDGYTDDPHSVYMTRTL